ncbi:hypothetical protein [Lysobacter sp. P5_B9]
MNTLKTTLQKIAREEHMRYIDSGEATMRDLKSLNQTESHLHLDGNLVNVGIEASGYGLTAGNMGLNTYDVSVGFGPNTREARAFSERVTTQLRQHWALKVVPKDSGAFPDPSCAGKPTTPPNNSSKPTPLRGAA